MDKAKLHRKIRYILNEKNIRVDKIRGGPTLLGKFTRSGHNPTESRQHGLVGLFGQISNALDHYPSSRTLKRVFEATYSFSCENIEDTHIGDHQSKNYSDITADNFINELCNASHKARRAESFQEDIRPRDYKFIAQGERGVGKTFFMNYLSSAKGNIFDVNRVIHIRVNLTRVYEEWDIIDRIAHQATYIIRDKYLKNYKNSHYQELSMEGFKQFLVKEKYDGQSINNIFRQLKNLKPLSDVGIKNQTSVINEEELKSHSISKISVEIFEALIAYVNKFEWGLAFVIDGLDAIDIADNHQMNFRNWIEQTISIFASAKYKVAWLLFLRPESYHHYKNKYEGKAQQTYKHTLVEIKASCPYKVIEKRFKNLAKSKGYPVKFVSYYYVGLIEFIGNSLEVCPKTVLHYLLAIFNNNMRRLLRNVHLASIEYLKVIELSYSDKFSFKDEAWHDEFSFQEFVIEASYEDSWVDFISKDYSNLTGEMKRYSYKIVECLVNGEALYHNESISFKLIDGKISKSVEKQMFNVSGVMPNIYGFPRELYQDIGLEDSFYFSRWFFKLIFLASLEDSYSERSSIPLPYSICDLRPKLESLGVPRLLFEYLVSYFESYGLIEVKADVDDREVHLTGAGRFLNKKLVSNPDYFSCILNSMMMPRIFVMEAGFIQLFDGKKVDRSVSSKLNYDLISKKLTNSLIFCRFLKVAWEEAKKELGTENSQLFETIDRMMVALSQNYQEVAEHIVNRAINDKIFTFADYLQKSFNYVVND